VTRRGEAGLTMVELMMSLGIAAIAMGAAFAVATTVQGQYTDHRQMMNTEQSARIALELLADGVRGAGPGVPTGVIDDAVGCSSPSIDALRVTNDVPAGTIIDGLEVAEGTDILEMVRPAGGIYTTVSGVYAGNATSIPVVSGAGFASGDYVLVTNVVNRGTIVKITAAPGATSLPTPNRLATCASADEDYGEGDLAIRARIERYFVAAGADEVPMLYVDLDADGADFAPEPFAPGIEDLQLAVAVDQAPEDGVLNEAGAAANDDEWHGNVAGETLATEIQPPPATPVSWRALRVTLVSRATQARNETASYFRPAVEDHAAATAADTYRRRVLSTIVELRNQGASP
jgi:hypothetical protein